jgi:GNAT superfamily N-acetyltransferase
MNNFEICQLEQSQISKAAEVAAKAFEDDPVFANLIPYGQASRSQILTQFMQVAIAYCAQYKSVHSTPDLQGIAAGLPLGEFSLKPLPLLKSIFQLHLYTLPFQVSWRHLGRWLRAAIAIEQAHQQDMGRSPHWYLAVMAVHPASQGQGLGSQLLKPILQRANNEALPCYLVTFTEQAVHFYEKNGFKVIRTQPLAANAPSFWTLKRDP